jgi:hypothetical protein
MVGEEHQRLADVFTHGFDSPQQVRALVQSTADSQADGLIPEDVAV